MNSSWIFFLTLLGKNVERSKFFFYKQFREKFCDRLVPKADG